jgi:hypothetical protein
MGYVAEGMQSALDSAIGLPRSSTSASLMLAFLMPADVSSILHVVPLWSHIARRKAIGEPRPMGVVGPGARLQDVDTAGPGRGRR